LRQVVLDSRSFLDTPEFDGGDGLGADDIPFRIIAEWVNNKRSLTSYGGGGQAYSQDYWVLEFANSNTTINSGTPVTAVDVYAKFRHESVLAALIAVAQAAGEHFRLGTGRTLEWVNGTWEPSDIHAVYGAPNPVSVEERTEIAQIASIEKITDSQDIVNRVFLYGAGEGDSRLDLSAADEFPDGNSLHDGLEGTAAGGPYRKTGIFSGECIVNKSIQSSAAYDNCQNFLMDLDSVLAYNINEMALTFKNLSPLSNTNADMTSAANQLLRSGFQWMKTRTNPQDFYQLSLRGVQGAVKVGETFRVTARRYMDGQEVIDIDETLNVLEATTEVAIDGLRTVGLMVSTTDRYPSNDTSVLVESLAEAVVSQAHQQISPNSWTENHVSSMDDAHPAQLDFWLGEDIVELKQVMLRFRVDQLRSTIRGGLSGHQHDFPAITGHTHELKIYPIEAGNVGSEDLIVYRASTNGVFPIGYSASSGTVYTAATEEGGAIEEEELEAASGDAVEYGVFKEGVDLTLGQTLTDLNSDLGLRLNSTESNVDRMSFVLASNSDGWYELDITALLVDEELDTAPGTNRPKQEANYIQIYDKLDRTEFGTPGPPKKSAQITFKLQVRCSIQSVRYS